MESISGDKASKDDIKVGTVIVGYSNQEIVVTNVKRKYCTGYIAYKGVHHTVFFDYGMLSNPHYNKNITIKNK